MASEQENRIVAEVMDNMKMAETEESSARRYVRRAVDKILIYCCREDLPERLEGTADLLGERVAFTAQAVCLGLCLTVLLVEFQHLIHQNELLVLELLLDVLLDDFGILPDKFHIQHR